MIDHYRQAFREEAGELLAELETALLELEKSPTGGEIIGRVFRALHTIKGSSAMFGFDAVAAFTHDIETVFDRVRGGGLAVDSDIVRLTLLARDLIKTMIVASPGDDEAKEAEAQAVQVAAFFRKIASGSSLPSGDTDSCPPPGEAGPAGTVTYLIRFRPEREIFRNGVKPLLLLNELSRLGECRVTAVTEGVPPLEELDPTLCYLSWELLLASDRGMDAIQDVFIFAGDGGLEIETLGDGGEEAVSHSGGVTGSHGETCGVPLNAPFNIHESGSESRSRDSISSIRVSAEKLDSLVNLVGELVTVQARLSRTAAGRDDSELVSLAEEVERLTGELRDNALNIRMLPIGSTFSRFSRVVHDLAVELGKEVEMVTSGAETELDKTVIEMLNDPLIHLIRNCIDHGIESPQLREAAGKPRRGTVELTALHSGDSVLVTISDDGAGIDLDAVRARGVETGLITAAAELQDKELLAVIFAPGFSMAQEVTSISGRGVGMDVVKRGVDALRGSISVSSRLGAGTSFTIRIPLTLAIIESLLVQVGADCYILPLSLVEECLELTREDVARTHGRHLINVRDQIVPYIRLRDRFGVEGSVPEIEQIVVTEVAGKRVGLVVDHVIGGHQTVIKSLGRMFRQVSGISGATILGDGTVALILDVPQLVEGEDLAERASGT